jgi:hypothetical protein
VNIPLFSFQILLISLPRSALKSSNAAAFGGGVLILILNFKNILRKKNNIFEKFRKITMVYLVL